MTGSCFAPTWRDDEFYGSGRYKFTLKLDLYAYQGFDYNASTYHDIARLYLIADVLITEYSSVFFDFANLRRPMLFTTEEIIAALRDLPGMEERYRERYRLFYDKYCGWEKGDASRKVAERVFRL